MSHLKMHAIVLFALALLVGSVVSLARAEEKAKPAAPTFVESGWQKRCADGAKKGEKYCEIFQKIGVEGSDKRLAEFAIGFPEGKNAARGVVILPLGILLEKIGMKVDDEKPSIFNVRYCSNDGCFSFVNLNKDIISSMKKGKKVQFIFKTHEGQDVNLVMGLSGFEKTFKGLQ